MPKSFHLPTALGSAGWGLDAGWKLFQKGSPHFSETLNSNLTYTELLGIQAVWRVGRKIIFPVNNSFSASHLALVLTKLAHLCECVHFKKYLGRKLPMALVLFEPVVERGIGLLAIIKYPDVQIHSWACRKRWGVSRSQNKEKTPYHRKANTEVVSALRKCVCMNQNLGCTAMWGNSVLRCARWQLIPPRS